MADINMKMVSNSDVLVKKEDQNKCSVIVFDMPNQRWQQFSIDNEECKEKKDLSERLNDEQIKGFTVITGQALNVFFRRNCSINGVATTYKNPRVDYASLSIEEKAKYITKLFLIKPDMLEQYWHTDAVSNFMSSGTYHKLNFYLQQKFQEQGYILLKEDFTSFNYDSEGINCKGDYFHVQITSSNEYVVGIKEKNNTELFYTLITHDEYEKIFLAETDDGKKKNKVITEEECYYFDPNNKIKYYPLLSFEENLRIDAELTVSSEIKQISSSQNLEDYLTSMLVSKENSSVYSDSGSDSSSSPMLPKNLSKDLINDLKKQSASLKTKCEASNLSSSWLFSYSATDKKLWETKIKLIDAILKNKENLSVKEGQLHVGNQSIKEIAFEDNHDACLQQALSGFFSTKTHDLYTCVIEEIQGPRHRSESTSSSLLDLFLRGSP